MIYSMLTDFFFSDELVGNATSQPTQIPTTTLTNASTYSGQTSYGGYTYHTNVQYVSGLLQNTSTGINHAATVAVNGQNAIDGLVAVLSVTITQRPPTTSSRWVFFASLNAPNKFQTNTHRCYMTVVRNLPLRLGRGTCLLLSSHPLSSSSPSHFYKNISPRNSTRNLTAENADISIYRS